MRLREIVREHYGGCKVTKYVVTVVVGTLLLALLVTGTSAAQSQGLHWGFERGKQYYFTQSVQKLGETEPSQTNFKFICNTYPSIQDPLTDNSSLPYASFHTYFANGSPAESAIYWPAIAVPVGNWSLLSEVLRSHNANAMLPPNTTQSLRIVENNEQWGYIWDLSFLSPQTNSSLQCSYSRQDGVLIQFSIDSCVNNQTAYLTLTRRPMDPELQSILTTALALGIVVIAIIVYARFRRH